MLKALTFIVLNDEKFPPGSTFTKKELKEAGQSADNIQQLIDTGVLSEDKNAELHPDHQLVVRPDGLVGSDMGESNG